MPSEVVDRRQLRWSLKPASDFETFASSWNDLNRRTFDTPLLDSRFVGNLLQTFGRGDEVLAMASLRGQPSVACILQKKSWGSWQTFQPSQAPLGIWVQDPALTPTTVLRSLARELNGFALLIGISQQDPDLTPRPMQLAQIRTLDYIQTARITLAGDFKAYWEQRGKNIRRNTKRQRNRLERDGVSTRFAVITSREEMNGAVDAYGALEATGWKVGGGTAVAPDNRQGEFYRGTLSSFCDTEEAVVYQYWIADELAASDLCLQRNGVLYVLKTAYNEAHQARSPAYLMREEVMRRLFEQGDIERVEFYGRVMEWHTRWTNEIRTMFHTNYYRWSFLPAVLARARSRARRDSH